ncbi:MAG: hypothetical protein ACTSRZ_10620 [Promethearchaeota archaeon]
MINKNINIKFDINCPYKTMISYFDNQIGPNILVSNLDERNINEENKVSNEITKLLDIHEPGDFFIHYFNGDITASYIFRLKDNYTRGGEHLLMISLLFPKVANNPSYSIEIFQKLNKIESILKNYSNYLSTKTKLVNILRQINANGIKDKISPEKMKFELINAIKRKSNLT